MTQHPNHKIYEYRKVNKWTQQELAHYMGKSLSTINKHELGQSTLSIEWLEQYAKVFNTSVSDLLPDYMLSHTLTPIQNTLLGNWNNLTDKQQSQIMDLITSMANLNR